jgi:hypothetical protein
VDVYEKVVTSEAFDGFVAVTIRVTQTAAHDANQQVEQAALCSKEAASLREGALTYLQALAGRSPPAPP